MSTNPNLNKDIGLKIRELRKRQKLTREILAEKLNLSTRFLADVETGKVGVSLSTFKNICNILGTSADYLLSDSNEEKDLMLLEIESRIRQIDNKYIPYLNDIIRAYEKSTKEHS